MDAPGVLQRLLVVGFSLQHGKDFFLGVSRPHCFESLCWVACPNKEISRIKFLMIPSLSGGLVVVGESTTDHDFKILSRHNKDLRQN